MSTEGITVDELRAQMDGKPAAALIDYWLASDHTQRLKAVNKAIDIACNQLEKSKHKKQGKEEDEITLDICNMLQVAGFDITHDTSVGGHCDIVINGKDEFLWLGEAKIHDAYAWLDKGFQQLSTRYSTGVYGQDNAGIVIYCYVKDAKAMLDKWRKKLCESNPQVKTQDPADGNPLHFTSTHKHASSGLPFCVRHKAVSLYWKPKD